jgi:arylsulfatase A-like enzyme
MRTLAALSLLFVLSACRQPFEIVGQGDIFSSSGTRDCPLEAQPCEFLIEGDYLETYRAVPRPGWKFVRWERCGEQYPDCTFDAPADMVARTAGRTMPPTVAVFEPLGADRPNILTIMVDDLGFNDLAINNGNTAIHTPNMDQLSRDGVRFTRHYAAASCSPARASFLSGMVPERLGYIPNGPGLSPQLTTLPERLRQEGYTTWHIGKWHIGDLYPSARPDQQGFDHWFGFLNQWRLAGDFAYGQLQLTSPRYEDPWLEGDEAPGQHYPGHLENILTDKAEEVLSNLEAQGGPWYLNLWFYAPHAPTSPAQEFAVAYPDTNDGRYRALVHQLDYNIGRVISHLESLGALENTIVVVVSDNGGAANTLDNNENNAPFAGFKGWLFEGSLRTPLIVRWPQRSLAGTVYEGVVSIEDIYPSLLEAIDAAPEPQLDGVSFLPDIQGLGPSAPRPLFWESAGSYNTFSVLSADHRWKTYQPPPIWGVVSAPLMCDMEQDPTGASSLDPLPEPAFSALYNDYADWFRQVHMVATHYTPTTNGAGILTGSDLLRTPGLGYYTFGVGVAHDFRGLIAAQQGTWQISRTDNTVVAQLGELVLTGEIAGLSDCHSIVLSGNFEQRTSLTSFTRTRVSLYIDGYEVDALDTPTAVVPADLAAPTAIGDASVESNGVIYPPRILNRSLRADTVWPVEAFSAELCPSA